MSDSAVAVDIRELHRKHVRLFHEARQTDVPQDALVQQADALLQELRGAGRSLVDESDREQIASYASYWGSFIAEKAGSYPDIKLDPLDPVALGNHATTTVSMGETVFHMPSPAPRAAAAQERRNRARMLARVRKTWIEGVLEPSLRGGALQALRMERVDSAVPDRWGVVAQEFQEAPRPLPSQTRIADVFDEFDGELLILGEPGAGKTTMLLELARTLLERAEQDEAFPMPVVFPLSTWAVQRRPLAEWLVGELVERYDLPRPVAKIWVATDQILPLLDGLDEMRAEHRAACVAAINAFREGRHTGLASLVVCCRTAEYRELDIRLRLRGAVLLLPLTSEQIDAYLASAGAELATLRAALRRDAVLAELARSPLTLSLLALTYQGAPAEALPTGGSAEERRARLFAAYVDRMFARRGVSPHPRYPQAQTVRWLAWLAGAMSRQGQTVFYLDRLQPEWLPTAALRRQYTLVDRLGGGLFVGLAAGLVGALGGMLVNALGGMLVGALVGALGGALLAALLGGSRETHFRYRRRVGDIVRDASLSFLLVGLIAGLVVGGAAGLVVGLTAGLIVGVAAGLGGALAGGPGLWPRYIAVVETIRWSFSKALSSGVAGLVVGSAAGLVVGSAAFLAEVFGSVLTYKLAGLGAALPVWLVFGLLGGSVFTLLGGLVRGGIEDETKVVPNEGIRRSARAAITFGLAGALLLGLAAELAARLIFGEFTGGLAVGLSGALAGALAGGLSFGGYGYVSHTALRFVLWKSGAFPIDCIRFLDYATDHIFLHRVGGGYMFAHRLLQDYFAFRYTN